MQKTGRLLLASAVCGLLCVGAIWAPLAKAWEITAHGEFIFDINNTDDMREVGTRSGIAIRDDIDIRNGYLECRRWTHAFGVSPYRAVVSGYLPGRARRVWICRARRIANPRPNATAALWGCGTKPMNNLS